MPKTPTDQRGDENHMIPPMVSFITWNRLGLTDRNLKVLLRTDEDFELYLADNGSRDGTWDYLCSLSDPRIKSRVRFEANRGPVYAANYHLSRRKKDQYFITVDSDVNIHSPAWITKFMEVFREFPDVGLLGAVTKEFMIRYRQPMISHEKGTARYLEIVKGFVEGCCQCIRPELTEMIGYWNEECCTGDMELSYRILNHTPFRAGFIPSIEIDQLQYISCGSCRAAEFCGSPGHGETGCGDESVKGNCFLIHERNYRNPQFRNRFRYKYLKFIRELEDGSKGVFCGSIHDEASMVRNRYDPLSAYENFRYYESQSGGN
jgi:glycosyltransferase involved in cell wall biosynthesis